MVVKMGNWGEKHQWSSGHHQPLGARALGHGVNFALYSHAAERVQLVVWDHPERRRPSQVIDLSPVTNKTGSVWHVFVHDLRPGAAYAYRVDGPKSPGNRFDWDKCLLDPYARAIDRRFYERAAACEPGDNVGECVRGVVVGEDYFDWGDDRLPRVPAEKSVIYECHVKGVTAHPSSGVQFPGTFAGLTEKLDYFADLGVTALELMPVQAFDDDVPRQNSRGEELGNYWGYSQLSFMAIEPSYFARGSRPHLSELKKLVKRAHSLGLEIILDVVFNHTTEANHQGPTLSWRGIDNRAYYLLSAQDERYYMNFTGCDNTFNSNSRAGSRLIIDTLEYLAREFHVDGFRFDLGGTFYYTADGYTDYPEIIKLINRSPVLRGLKLSAEPWDASGLVLEGRFGGPEWLEWSGSWRNRVRRWVNFGEGEADVKAHLAGQAPEFVFYHKNPARSVNFACVHDGFTLRDVVSYNYKHNEENGFANQDGSNDNNSCNYGVEGESDDPELLASRQKRAWEMLRLTASVPEAWLISMGDEMWRTQGGNNNAFVQDNAISWLDWRLLEQFPAWHERVKALIKAKSGR